MRSITLLAALMQLLLLLVAVAVMADPIPFGGSKSTTTTTKSSTTSSTTSTTSSATSTSTKTTTTPTTTTTTSSSSSSITVTTTTPTSSSSSSSSSSTASSTTTTTGAPTKTFTLNVGYATLAPDGYSQNMIVANGQVDYPIIVNKGDNVEVVVNNNLDVPTSLHWHGMFQAATPWYDGAAGITQCPIPSKGTFTYKFSTGDQVGTFWWHAHYKSQYIAGLRGPFIINDPASPYANAYDEDLIITLADHYHNTTDYLLNMYFTQNSGNIVEPIPESGLINSAGRYDCTKAPKGKTCKANNALGLVKVTQNKRYRLRIINMSSMAAFQFTIDNHPMTVIESDGIYTQATVSNNVTLGTAERYSVIINATQPVSSYWIRATMMDMWTEQGANPFVNGLNLDVRAVLQYSGSTSVNPTTSADGSNPLDAYHLYELTSSLPYPTPVYNQYSVRFNLNQTERSNNINRAYMFVTQDNDGSPFLNDTFVMPTNGNLLAQMISGQNVTQTTPTVNPISVTNGSWWMIEVVNDDTMEHVFHLHGHAFWVLGTGLTGDAKMSPPQYARKDTIRVPRQICKPNNSLTGFGCSDGFVHILVHFDHPGAWLLHCHIEWHMQAGMAVTFINQDGIGSLGNPPAAVTNLCSAGGLRGGKGLGDGMPLSDNMPLMDHMPLSDN